MLKVYGSRLCKDCVACKAVFEEQGVAFEYHDFGEELSALKEFLKIRDASPLFDEIKNEGRIGIPCIIREDGSVSLDWEEFVTM